MGSGGGNKGSASKLDNSWAPKPDYILAQEADISNLNKAVDQERLAQEQIRKQQKALLEIERAKRSAISTKTKRNTIKTGAKGIASTRQSMPTTIAGGNISDMPNSGSGTIVGG